MTRQVIKKKVFVGLSGGVDSSVSAALLKSQGFDVTGVFIRVWSGDTELTPNGEHGTDAEARLWRHFSFSGCTAADDRLDAMRVCAHLGIPFRELDLEKEYKRDVVDYMIREYKAGRTPNPDVSCNRYIKFGGFYKWAMKRGADFVATGHYARVLSFPRRRESSLDSRLRGNDRLVLGASPDTNKDQSYFLWQIRKEQLPHLLFPVGGMRKPEVRKLAKKFGLITAEKKDSQGLCFVGKVDMKEFLSHYIKPKRGDILLAADERGPGRRLTQMKDAVIGEHDGAFFYTLGERIGISSRLNLKSGKRFNLEKSPFYIIAKDMKQNTLTVSHKSPAGDLPRARNEVAITDCNWLMEPEAGKTYSARVRYRQPLQEASVKYEVSSMKQEKTSLPNTKYIIQFSAAQTAAEGQSLVLYEGDVVVGGGIIS